MQIVNAKVLMYKDHFVDFDNLHDGLFTSIIPTKIFSSDADLKTLIKYLKTQVDMNNICFYSESFFKNLNQCELKNITINVT